MSRPLRISYCGAWYHVMNRGLARQHIFFNDQHRRMFIELLLEVSNRYQAEIHAYCLMNNHYHLLLRTPLANISRIMRHVDGVYTQRLNCMINRDGPLFRGRYKAILVEADTYLLRLSRYIHLNPVKSKLVGLPETYTWSSYKDYVTENGPCWLHTKETLNYFGDDKIKKYKTFVEEGIDKEIENYYKRNKSIPILGTDTFIKSVTENYLKEEHKIREVPEHKLLLLAQSESAAQIIQKIAKYYCIDEKEIKIKQNGKNELRMVGMYLLQMIGQYSFVEIASYFTNISASGVSKICKRVSTKINTNLKFKCEIDELKKKLLVAS